MNPIQYTSKSYDTILADINSDPELADKPDWWKRAIAGIGDVISMWNNAAANDAYLPTAFTRPAVHNLCALIGYVLASPAPSVGTVIFHLDGSVSSGTFAATDLVASTRGTIAAGVKRFEARASSTLDTTAYTTNLTTNPPSGNAVLVSRDFTTGEKVRVTGSSLPSGLAAGTDYWIIRVDATHIKFSTSLTNARAGSAITISGGSGTMSTYLRSLLVTVYQQETKPTKTIGNGDSSTQWLELDLPDTDILSAQLTVKVDGTEWTRVDSLAFSSSIDQHYQHVFRSDGSSFVRFGDGTNGAIPGSFEITADYAVGGGADGNVSAGSINVYAGSNASILTVYNPSSMTGGTDEESIERAKRIAPGFLKSRDRFITVEDGINLVLAYGGVQLCTVLPNEYGVVSAKVIGIATGGGNPNPTLQATIQTYLMDRSVMGSIDVRFVDATITSEAVTSAVHMLPGYVWADVLPYFRLAWKMFFSEAGAEIVEAYDAYGLDYAITRINSILSESFSANDLKVQQVITTAKLLGTRTFGDAIQQDDAISFVRSAVSGIDYMTIATPSFPIVLANSEITTPGTLTLTEV
jgi:hypothetical protein